MAVAAAEQFVYVEQAFADVVPLVEVVPQMPEDVLTRQKAARFIGACAIDSHVDITFLPEALSPIESLYDAIQQAAEGSAEARKMITTNVATDVVERTIKKGHVIKIDLHEDEAGRIQQFGQSMESVQANSLKLAANNWQMRERTEAEATNTFRIDDHYKQGTLQDYNFVVFSRAADNMSKQQMDDAGFFTDTMSVAIQVTTQEGAKLTTESAFVAGVKSRGEARHDADTITKLGAGLGVDLGQKSAAEVIGTPLLMHKSLMPNGVIDLVRLYDEAAGGTFFGERALRQDYLQYRQQCTEREQQLQPSIQAITNELIGEAPTIVDRLHATQRLHKISEKHMVQQAMFDTSIDLRVFGPAEAHILAARQFHEDGDEVQAAAALNTAVKVAKSSSCPTGTNRAAEQATNSSKADGASESTEKSGKRMMHCPFCDARVYGDPCAKVLSCWDCRAMVKNGRVTSKGDGGSKARAAKVEEARRAATEAMRAQTEAALAEQVDAVFEERNVKAGV